MEKLVITIWLGFAGLRATLGSVPPVASVLAKFAVVLLTAGSTTTGVVTPAGTRTRGERSSGIAGRDGWLRSGGELLVAAPVALGIASNEKGSTEAPAADPATPKPVNTPTATTSETKDSRPGVRFVRSS